VKQGKLLDSFAVIAYLSKESGYEKVREALAHAQSTGGKVLMNDVNVGEVYYILARKRGFESAEYFIATILPSLPIRTIPNTLEDVVSAAKIKAQYPLSYADCFAVDTARRHSAGILTGDPEFKKVGHLVEICWINK